MQHFLPDVAILSPVAIAADRGATNYSLGEADLGRVMIERAAKLILLADHLKIGKTSRMRLCACDEVDVLVTDHGADPTEVEAMKNNGIGEILLA